MYRVPHLVFVLVALGCCAGWDAVVVVLNVGSLSPSAAVNHRGVPVEPMDSLTQGTMYAVNAEV